MNKLLSNLTGLVIVGFLPYLVNFIVLPIYSQNLDAQDFGLIGLAMASMAIASTWSHLQLPGALSRIYYDYSGEERIYFISTIVNSGALIAILFSGVYIFFSAELSSLIFHSSNYVDLIMMTSIMLMFNVINLFFERLLINQERGFPILIRGIICQVISVCGGVYFIVIQDLGALGFVYSQAMYYFSMCLVSFFLIRRQYRFYIKYLYLKESLKYSFPLIFHAIGGVVFMYSSVFFIENLMSLSVLGVFFIADKFAQFIKALVNSVNNVVMPYYHKISVSDFLKGKMFLELLVPMWLAFFIAVIVNFSFLANIFLVEFMHGDYGDVFIPILVMCLACVFRGLYCFSSAPLFFGKKTSVIAKVTILTGVVSLILNYVMIKVWGLNGAALSIFLSFVLSFILAWYYSVLVYRVNLLTMKNLYISCFALMVNFFPNYLLAVDAFFVCMLINIFLVIATFIFIFCGNLFGIKDDFKLIRGYI